MHPLLLIAVLLFSISPATDFATEPNDCSFYHEGEEVDYKFEGSEMTQIQYSIEIGFYGGDNFDEAEIYLAWFDDDTYTSLAGDAFQWEVDFWTGNNDFDYDEYFIENYTAFDSSVLVNTNKWLDTGHFYAIAIVVNGTQPGDDNIDTRYFYTWYANKAGRVIVYENVTLPESQWISDTWSSIIELVELYGMYSIPGTGAGISAISYAVKKRKERNQSE